MLTDMESTKEINQMPNKSEAELTEEEKWRRAHIKMHEQHRGHESMHAEMMLILLVTLTIAQFILVIWKKKHPKSYQFATLIGLWIIPFAISLKNYWLRFIFLWLLISCTTCLVVKKATEAPVKGTTPRLVYKWFYLIYKISYALGFIGYSLTFCTIFGINLLFDLQPHVCLDLGLLFMFYGLYFGVLGRDVAEICADTMASHIGYYTPDSMPTRNLEPNVCAVCGNKLLVSEHEKGVIENTYKLNCEHVFHEFCIRGWCIVGKKQICPYCKEKVDLKKMFRNPWQRPDVLYSYLLNWLRWLVAWQPLIVCLVKGIHWALGLE